ncbi:NAD(P)H-dependent glycerol-3-phosphate dehydrogenase [Chelatococcus asaccharovorans]|uniref:NAD(P)H-dependent glycerol-3-phosphate dehydrogenase n=1 Tax=Chelatococcus asaccharovorans TaxID=28210 RepID=UPI00224C79C8|nr:NAD(P)H-dependent glycerol-3-phosphate dehydrogenase [Chelatococcus asaccharovorans]CAH1664414.1 Glycerol-3-phosphate dehydrogenase (NAD(P)+) [Chelatococcus asaccharovorans]CAH1682410.1 Glycerol-3-phosphate dehydrogenase (NAD(P)+) [Chelatococcus asaccharovorans]
MLARTKLLLIGFGTFGQAIANALSSRSDLSISVCTRSPRSFPSYITRSFTDAMDVPMDDFDIVVLALPSFAVGQALSALYADKRPQGVIVSCAKGLDPHATQFVSQVIQSTTGSDAIAVLAGASFAHEMMEDSPVFLTLACTNPAIGKELIDRLETAKLHLELATDVRGMEVVGVAKNILAVGAGIADGLNLGENFRATYIARGVAELSRIITMLGGDSDTISKIGALSDIILTCSSDRSRNYRLGRNIAVNRLHNASLAEGLHSAGAFVNLLERQGAQSRFFSVISEAMGNPSLIVSTLFR